MEVQEAGLQARELICLVDQRSDLKSDDALGSVVHPRNLHANEFF
jgi:hypothetical protein